MTEPWRVCKIPKLEYSSRAAATDLKACHTCRVVALGARAEPLATTTRTVEPTAGGGQISKINKTRGAGIHL